MFLYTDRYKALGIPYPNPGTVCKGNCEGIGFYPVKNDEKIEPLEYQAWLDAHNEPDAHKEEPCNGWHFIKCLECNGTGLKQQEDFNEKESSETESPNN